MSVDIGKQEAPPGENETTPGKKATKLANLDFILLVK